MRLPLLALFLTLVACGTTDPVEPAPEDDCEPMPYCEALEGDVVRDSLKTLPPDSVP